SPKFARRLPLSKVPPEPIPRNRVSPCTVSKPSLGTRAKTRRADAATLAREECDARLFWGTRFPRSWPVPFVASPPNQSGHCDAEREFRSDRARPSLGRASQRQRDVSCFEKRNPRRARAATLAKPPAHPKRGAGRPPPPRGGFFTHEIAAGAMSTALR